MRFKLVLKYLFFLTITTSLVLLYGFSSTRNLEKKVSIINIKFEEKNSKFLTNTMVNKLLIQNDQTVEKLQKSVIDLYGLENQVNDNPYVKKSSVFLTINGTLNSIVKQRNPIARIVTKDNSYYIDEEGVKMPLSAIYSARVLLISGFNEEESLREIVNLVTVILKDEFLKKELIGIHKFENEEYQFAVRSGDYKIDFGKSINIDVKFKKLKAFYSKVFLDKTIHQYKTVNIKYHNQVVCTK